MWWNKKTKKWQDTISTSRTLLRSCFLKSLTKWWTNNQQKQKRICRQKTWMSLWISKKTTTIDGLAKRGHCSWLPILTVLLLRIGFESLREKKFGSFICKHCARLSYMPLKVIELCVRFRENLWLSLNEHWWLILRHVIPCQVILCQIQSFLYDFFFFYLMAYQPLQLIYC